MADIKDLGIFGHNKGLEKMKKDAEKKKQLADITEKKGRASSNGRNNIN